MGSLLWGGGGPVEGGRGSLPSLSYHLPFLEKGLGTHALAVWLLGPGSSSPMISWVPGSPSFSVYFLSLVLGCCNRQGPIKIAIQRRHSCVFMFVFKCWLRVYYVLDLLFKQIEQSSSSGKFHEWHRAIFFTQRPNLWAILAEIFLKRVANTGHWVLAGICITKCVTCFRMVKPALQFLGKLMTLLSCHMFATCWILGNAALISLFDTSFFWQNFFFLSIKGTVAWDGFLS
jgi:hypothetical protein